MSIALIDGDVLTYICGFSGDKTYYTIGNKKFKYHKAGKEWCKDNDIDFKELEKHHEPGNLKQVLSSVDFLIERTMDKTESNTVQIYLTGKGNFRDEIAVTLPYKGQRTGNKPHHYKAIREHLKSAWDAEVINGMEADDALGIAQSSSPEETTICSIDKDLLMIPGWHYDLKKEEFTEVSEFQGWVNFYTQLLVGDRIDNIQGLAGIGPVTAKSILEPWRCPEGMMCEVALQYAKHYDDPEARMYENANLLYIRRCENDSWNWEKHSE